MSRLPQVSDVRWWSKDDGTRIGARSRVRALLKVLATVTCVALVAGPAHAQSGIQVTPDGKRTLVSKDVGGQRWAITRNPDGTVTGNVFSPGGGAPQFVWCQQTSTSEQGLGFACSGAQACVLGPCEADEWTFIADVVLPESFFQAAATASAVASAVSAITPSPMIRFALARPAGGVGGSSSGLQITPDDARTLLSKDVGVQRWAISRNEDGTATGNVFFPGGGDPQFVWCEPTGESDGNVGLRCLGANACARDGSDACNGSAGWSLIAEVTLPLSFFTPRTQVSVETLSAALVAAYGEEGGAAAYVLALDRGYTPSQVARAILSGTLQADGAIVAISGATEPPDGEAVHRFTSVSAAARVLSAPVFVTLEQFLELAKRAGQNVDGTVALVLLGLSASGYPMEQIVEQLVLFDGKFVFSRDGIFLVNAEGAIIKPDLPAPPVFSPPPSVPLCGNGQIDGVEECDGATFGGATCASRGAPGAGALRCIACQIFTWDCQCGDGKIDPGEECDGSQLQGRTCASYNLDSGNLTCSSSCAIDTKGCELACPTGGAGCCGAGEKSCNGICIPDAAPCCGDGIREGNESCDRTDLGGATCANQGQGSGLLRCDGACGFDTSGCTGGGTCPGGTFACEGGCAPNGADCCTGESGYCNPGSVCVGEGRCCPSSAPQRCGNQCLPANATCCQGTSCCGNGNLEGSEVCDGAELNGQTCTSQGKAPGALHCSPSCNAFDYSDCGCGQGFKLCGDTCIFQDDVCCQDGSFCQGDETCSPGGGCCGNGAREGGETCDGSAGCGSGQVCNTDCKSCVSATSCAGRCCGGRDDSCTPPGVSCFCDQYCVEAQDCCGDYGQSCG